MLYSKLYDFTKDHQDINVTIVKVLKQKILMLAEVSTSY